MYSVILMATMTTAAPETPQFGFRRGCNGCGGYVSSCYGYGGGCYGRGYDGYARGYSAYPAGGWGCNSYSGYSYAYPRAYSQPMVIVGDVWGAHYHYSATTPFLPGWRDYRVNPEDARTAEVDESLGGTARLILDVPADAKIYVDGQLTKSTSANRQFSTPKLAPVATYFYDVRVESTKDNKPVVVEKRVFIRANEIVRTSFASPPKSVAMIAK